MHSRGIGNLSHDLESIKIHDHDFGSVRNIEAAGGAIDGEIVPAAFAADLQLVGDVIAVGGRAGCEETQQQKRTKIGHGGSSLVLQEVASGSSLSATILDRQPENTLKRAIASSGVRREGPGAFILLD